MATSIISAPSIPKNLSMIGYSVSWTGATPVGAISVQVSNDLTLYPNGQINNPGTWSTMAFLYNGATVTSIPISGNTGNGFIDITRTAAYATRLVYTATSGTGTLQAIFNAKVA